MSKRSQQKRQSRAKEKAKAARRHRNASPLALLGPETSLRCYQQGGPDGDMARLSIFRDLTDGRIAFAGFLIDYRCLGVKDAYTMYNLDHDDIRRITAGNSRRISADAARSLVAAAIRWNGMHPFRLPGQIQRCLVVLGGTLDIERADVSDFGTEDGGLDYLGYKSDLVNALEIPLQDFLDRDDVTAAFVRPAADDFDENDDDEIDAEDEEYDFDDDDDWMAMLGEKLGNVVSTMLDGSCKLIADWATRTGRSPHPALRDALLTMCVNGLKKLIEARSDPVGAGPSPDSDVVLAPTDVPTEQLEAALTQIQQFLADNPGVELFTVPEDAFA